MKKDYGKPRLLKDLGVQTTGKQGYRVRLGVYECPKCKNSWTTSIYSVNSGLSTTCGCYSGVNTTRLFKIWTAIIQRITNVNAPTYKDYGGRGIKVCDEWSEDFFVFQKWALTNGYSEFLTIDRRENDGNYSPENCRWATKSEQNLNRRPFGKSKFRGEIVGYKHKWVVQIGGGKSMKTIYLGTYENEEEAARVYDKYVVDNDLPNLLNFPEEHNRV